MSGGVEERVETSGFIKEVMEKFEVDEKTAEGIIAFSNVQALERMGKWRRNFSKLQKEKAEDVYRLIKKLRNNVTSEGVSTLEIIEKKVLEMCVGGE